jgi:hypothetical protein
LIRELQRAASAAREISFFIADCACIDSGCFDTGVSEPTLNHVERDTLLTSFDRNRVTKRLLATIVALYEVWTIRDYEPPDRKEYRT